MLKPAAQLLLIVCLGAGARVERFFPQIHGWLAARPPGDARSEAPRPDRPDPAAERVAGTRTVHRTVTLAGPTPYDSLIARYATRTGIRPALVKAVIEVESGFAPDAVSRAGAMGLMQLMPGTAHDLGVTDPYDPDDNVRGGTAYLGQLLSRFQGDEVLALAAYNAGPTAVHRFGDRIPPYSETQRYVRLVQDAAERHAAQASSNAEGSVEKTYAIEDGWWTIVHTTYTAPNRRVDPS